METFRSCAFLEISFYHKVFMENKFCYINIIDFGKFFTISSLEKFITTGFITGT